MNAPPYTAKDRKRFSLVPSEVSAGGKKSWAMISLKKPKIAKSYHSRTLPSVPAMVCFGVGFGDMFKKSERMERKQQELLPVGRCGWEAGEISKEVSYLKN